MVKPWHEDKCVPVSLCRHLLSWLDGKHTFAKDVRLVLDEGVGKDCEGVDWRSIVVGIFRSSSWIRKLPSVLLVHLPIDVDGEQALLVHNAVSLPSNYLSGGKIFNDIVKF